MEQDIFEKEIDLNSRALELLREYYEDFYNSYAATDPKKVQSIQYFLDWLKTDAKPEDIDVKVMESHLRNAKINVEMKYFWKISSDLYSDYHYVSGDVNALFSDSAIFSEYFHDVYYTEHANSNVVPANFYDAAKSEAKKALYEQGSKYIFSDARVIDYEISEPFENVFYNCNIKYPHPVQDKVNGFFRSFNFIIWKDKLYFYNGNGPMDESGKTGGCYVATAVYGSYDCPEVWTLRRYRDETLASTWYGRAFIRLYYLISPTLVKWFGKTEWFKKMWKGKLDKMVENLNQKGVENTPYEDIDWTKK